MIKTKHFKSIFFFLAKAIFFLIFVLLFLKHASKSNLDFSNINLVRPWAWVICLALVGLNWWFEWKKWKLTIQAIQESENSNNLSAFASGIVSGFLTPALSGNFLGRVMYYDKSKRWKITNYALLANFGQFWISVFGGILALFWLKDLLHVTTIRIAILISISIIALILYFSFEFLFNSVSVFRIKSLVLQVKNGPSRPLLLVLSIGRHLIFILQYCLALMAFGVEINIEVLAMIQVVFLAITLTPSLFFGKIIVRETLAVTFFGMLSIPMMPILLASFSTWCINLLLPAIISLIYMKRRK